MGVAYVNPHSLICARLIGHGNERLDTALLVRRFKQALTLRERLFDVPFYRLVFGESDLLPGLVVDRFGAHLVVQLNTAGMDAARECDRRGADPGAATGVDRLAQRQQHARAGKSGKGSRGRLWQSARPRRADRKRREISSALARWPKNRLVLRSTPEPRVAQKVCGWASACSTSSVTSAASACKRQPLAQRKHGASTARQRRSTWSRKVPNSMASPSACAASKAMRSTFSRT